MPLESGLENGVSGLRVGAASASSVVWKIRGERNLRSFGYVNVEPAK